MSKSILINSTIEETRIAILEDSRVTDLLFERTSDRGIVGNVYKGKVVRVLPGMQAAFVDIGHERAAFLYAGDFYHSKHHSEDFEDEEESSSRRRRAYEDIPPINELVREGQEILVQVAKGPIGTKGARLTCHLSLPGRFLVFMPSLKHNGVSRKIENYEQRRRLKKIIDQHRPKEGGFIVRTAAGGGEISETQIKNDVDYLQNLWGRIGRNFKSNAAPKLLHYDLDITTRLIRDHLDEEIDYMLIDSKLEHRKVLKFIKSFNPSLKDKIELYQDPTPLFDRFDIESEIHRSLSKRVWLKSGGYLIIEHTEALTSIDVNTGRFVGKKTLEETILKTNLEAAEEIVRQLRLRNIGGIIIIDFIDMEKDGSKDQVYRYLDKLVREDKQKTSILRISNLGLVEMTRKRSREPLYRYLTQPCPECDGRAFLKNPMTLAHQALRDVRRELPHLQGEHLYLGVHPSVYEVLTQEESQAVINLEKQFQKGIRIESRSDFHIEQISINPQGSPKLKGAKLSPITYIQKRYGTVLEPRLETDEEYSNEEYEKDLKAIAETRAEMKFDLKKEGLETQTSSRDAEFENTSLENESIDPDFHSDRIPEAPLMRRENEVLIDEDEDEDDETDEMTESLEDLKEEVTQKSSSADKAMR